MGNVVTTVIVLQVGLILVNIGNTIKTCVEVVAWARRFFINKPPEVKSERFGEREQLMLEHVYFRVVIEQASAPRPDSGTALDDLSLMHGGSVKRLLKQIHKNTLLNNRIGSRIHESLGKLFYFIRDTFVAPSPETSTGTDLQEVFGGSLRGESLGELPLSEESAVSDTEDSDGDAVINMHRLRRSKKIRHVSDVFDLKDIA